MGELGLEARAARGLGSGEHRCGALPSWMKTGRHLPSSVLGSVLLSPVQVVIWNTYLGRTQSEVEKIIPFQTQVQKDHVGLRLK